MVKNTVHGGHISEQYNQELEEVKNHLMEMGGLVEQQVTDAVTALVEGNVAQAGDVIKRDTTINEMEVTIDEECTIILARRQPAASDLRLVMAIIKAITDLERIGDEASKVAKFAVELEDAGGSPQGYIEIRHISEKVTRMINSALDAFARLDAEAALAVARRDKTVDAEYASAMRSLVTYMMEDPRSITQVLNVIWSLRALERIGDHARNIAEHVVYMVIGKDVRHMGLQKMAEHVHEAEG